MKTAFYGIILFIGICYLGSYTAFALKDPFNDLLMKRKANKRRKACIKK